MDEVFADFPELETERLRLRELRLSDAPEILEILGDPQVVRYYDLPVFEALAEARNLIRERHGDFCAGRCIRWGLTFRGEEQLLGSIGYHRIDRKHGFAELGYDLARRHWRRGIMGETLSPVVRFGFEVMGLRRVEALVDPCNEASIALLESAGFTREAQLRKRYWDGETWQDDVIYSRLSDD